MSARIAGFAAFLALAAWFAVSAIDAFPHQLGIDFYQFWGVPLARAAGSIDKTPYVDQAPYARVLNAMAESSANEKFRNANSLRRDLEPMGTPFLYASFAGFSADYERSQRLYTLLLYAAAGIAIFTLARLRGLPAGFAACVALLVMLTFNPFAQDVRSGNVNSLQLALLVALVAISATRRFTGNAWIDGLFVGVLALFVAFKPNTPWIALAVAMHYLALRGLRAFAIGAFEAVLLGAAAFAIGAWEMGGAHAWLEWLQLARGMDGSAMSLPFERGNLSLALVVSRLSPALGSVGWGLVLAGVLVLSVVLALSANGRRGDRLGAAARDAFGDPWFAVSVGILLTFAASPLVWPHYHVLLLIPIAWLIRLHGRCRACAWGAVACYVVLSRAVTDPLVSMQMFGLLQMLSLLSWVALVPGVMAHAARCATTAQERAESRIGT
ncbi:MAG TPA: glycosyltransferase 87 family protein [Usitatibacter sp.]|nr:glycosyltransferase 87 family protein [Usitatibacter sp.]